VIQSTIVLVSIPPTHSAIGIVWTGITAGAMFMLAAGKAKTAPLSIARVADRGQSNAHRRHPGDGGLIGLVLNAALGWWWPTQRLATPLYYEQRSSRCFQ